jgi:hypothetical protein
MYSKGIVFKGHCIQRGCIQGSWELSSQLPGVGLEFRGLLYNSQ